jgi:serine/threonine protein kinase
MTRLPDKIGQLAVSRLVDRGRFGSTYRVVGPDGGEADLRLLDLGDDDELRARVLEELERLALVDHQGVRQIYEIGDHEDSLFVAMSPVPEVTLEAIVDREGPLAEKRVAAIVEQTAEAVAALHDHGLVHGDLAPRNVLIGRDDEVTLTALSNGKLIDLGIVREDPTDSGYLAPEQVAQGVRSQAADVYGIGAVAYTALTGELPDLRRPVGSVRTDLVAPWTQLIADATSPNPQKRPSAAAFAEQAAFIAPHARDLAAEPEEEEPPRSAYARVDAPSAVVAGKEFDVTLGLAPDPDPEVIGEEMVLPDSIKGAYKLTIHLVASGFTLVDREDWTVELQVTAGLPYPTQTLRLVAAEPKESVQDLQLRALYSVGGQTIGEAVRAIAVRRDDGGENEDPPPPPPTFEVKPPDGFQAPDLEVTIMEDEDSPTGRLLWTYKSRHEKVKTPTEDISSSIGKDPQAFVTDLVRQMPTFEGQAGLFTRMRGIGRLIADCIPTKTWELLAEVAEYTDGRVPTVLLLSDEPYVPWEIAAMEKPLDSNHAPFFGAQVTIGRWILAGAGGRPSTPPRGSAAADRMAVVWGEYEGPGLERLEHAEQEADDLHQTYGAQKVEAKTEPVDNCLNGNPATDVLHFAVHGKYDPSGFEDGIILVDRKTLGELDVRGVDLDPPHFVFLNACQVGNGSEKLGIYSGMASAFVYAGASAVVAPLWSIDDGLARDLAKGFYEAAFAGASPADFLREKRASFTKASSPKSSINMAYQFFGHPGMQMARGDA